MMDDGAVDRLDGFDGDDESGQVRTLLTRTADAAGEFTPPSMDALVGRRTPARSRSGAAVLVSAVAIAAVAALVFGLAWPRTAPDADRPTLHAATKPTGPAVTLDDLAGYRWSALPLAPIAPRSDAASVWTGTQMLVWGGQGLNDKLYADGAAYNPKTKVWTKLPPSPLSARAGASAVWVGGYFVVWGGVDSANTLSDGARYDPSTDTWTRLPSLSPLSQSQAQLVVTGQRTVLLTTPAGQAPQVLEANSYDPETNRWTSLPSVKGSAGHEVYGFSALAIGSSVAVWIDWDHSDTVSTTPDGVETQTTAGVDSYLLDGTHQRWSTAPFIPAQGRRQGSPLWTGQRILLLDEPNGCGVCHGPFRLNGPGQSVDPDTGQSTVLPASPVNVNSTYVWTGGAVLALNPGAWVGPSIHPGDTAAWNPQANKWARLPSAPIGQGVSGATTVWTGDRLLVWGQIPAPKGTSRQPLSTNGLQFAPPGP